MEKCFNLNEAVWSCIRLFVAKKAGGVLLMLSPLFVLAAKADNIPVVHYDASTETLTFKYVDESTVTLTTTAHTTGDYRFNDETNNPQSYYDDTGVDENGNEIENFYYEYIPSWQETFEGDEDSNDSRAQITKVVIDESFKNYKPTLTCNWFLYMARLTEIDGLENIDMSGVKAASSMFAYCFSLPSLDLSSWKTSQLVAIDEMFSHCYSLKTITFGEGWDTSKVSTMYQTFMADFSMETLDLSGWNTSALTNALQMFYDCKSMKYIDLRSFDTSSLTVLDYMFSVTPEFENYLGSKGDVATLDGFGDNMLKEKGFNTLPSQLRRIYISDKWKLGEDAKDEYEGVEYPMFGDCVNLVGAYGTKYDANNCNYKRAVNDAEGSTGYLTQYFELKDTRDETANVGSIVGMQAAGVLSTEGLAEPVPTKLTRTLVKDGYNTLCLPFGVPKDMLDEYYPSSEYGLKLYILSNASLSSNIMTVTLTDATSDGIKAGTPYFVRLTKAIANPVFNSCHYTATSGSTVGGGDMTMTGCIVPTAIAKDDKNQRFITTDGTLKYNSTGTKLKGMRAYFTLQGSAAKSSAKSLAATYLLDGETTAITETKAATGAPGDNRWYDAGGRLLPSAPATTGLYIHNGHKIVINMK